MFKVTTHYNTHQNHDVGSCCVNAQDGHVTIWQLAHVQVYKGGARERFASDEGTDMKLYM